VVIYNITTICSNISGKISMQPPKNFLLFFEIASVEKLLYKEVALTLNSYRQMRNGKG
jgi:hypothetical protein